MRNGLDRGALLDWFGRNRRRSEEIFGLVAPEAYYDRPIALRNPICFYEGHLPAFSVNTLVKRALGDPGIDAILETLFERGIDPEDASAGGAERDAWPSREVIRGYAAEADRRVADALANRELVRPENPMLARGLAAFTILEHEVMHQETLLYMWQRLPFSRKRSPALGPAEIPVGSAPKSEMISIPAGTATLGAGPDELPFAWDNELPALRVAVPAFAIDAYNVSNGDYADFVESGGYRRQELWSPEGWRWRTEARVEHPLFWERDGSRWLWRGMFERVDLPAAWPVYVSHAEASAYASWKGLRLPTEAEYHRAAFSTPGGTERRYPWGDEPPDASRGRFGFEGYDPVPVGSRPAGASAWGVHDLVGNGWEWTSTVFEPFPGFAPMATYPQYSADFFDGKHYVMKGASPATGTELIRRSFRNWFRPNYPYVYATFRCAR